MIIDRCPSPERDFLASCKHPPWRMSSAPPPFLGSSPLVAHPDGSRLERDMPKALLKYLSDLVQMVPLLNVISIVDAAPRSGGHWETRDDVSRLLMNAPGENE